MIKVTHIITGLNRGGAERTLYSVLTNGLQDKFDNRVISLLDSGTYGPKLEATGISVTTLNINRDIKSLFTLANDFKLHPPDILQGWMYHGNLVATFAKIYCLTSLYFHGILDVRQGEIRIEVSLHDLSYAYCDQCRAGQIRLYIILQSRFLNIRRKGFAHLRRHSFLMALTFSNGSEVSKPSMHRAKFLSFL